MIEPLRKAYNEQFTVERYKQFLDDIDQSIGKPVLFRIAETPVFISEKFADKLILAGKEILDIIFTDDFKQLTEGSIPNHLRVPGENDHPLFICVDFAVCKDEEGELSPQLIEFQGFPSLFGWQAHIGEMFKKHFSMPEGYDFLIETDNMDDYKALLKKTILDNCDPENVILLEIRPEEQKTNADFYIIKQWLGIEPICLSKITSQGKNLYYEKDGKTIQVKRIYNRVIFDDLEKQENFTPGVDLTKDWNVVWAEHPHWFFRISKYTMPFLNSKYVPQTRFLHEVEVIPDNLDQYVLKPLFSFSGQGVIFDLKAEDIHKIPVEKRDQYILQKKVKYEPIIQAPNGQVKAEIRLLYIWPQEDELPTLATNLVRLSKGVMIGVRYNENQDWVGGTVGFFPKK
jgi:hypothetical protein